ncbi:MAG: hypothetical protein ACYC1U_00120 [Candidatus Aquicultorales bacterium]
MAGVTRQHVKKQIRSREREVASHIREIRMHEKGISRHIGAIRAKEREIVRFSNLMGKI